MFRLFSAFIAVSFVALSQTAPVVIPPGTTVLIRTIEPIDSKSAEVGATFRGALEAPIVLDGKEAAPKGGDATLRIIEAADAGKIQGKAQLTVTLVSVTSGADVLPVSGATVTMESGGKGRGSAAKIGGGAAGGAAVGGLFGGKKGAAIGAGAGAGAGTAAALLTGPHVKIPSETILTFKVE